MSNNNRKPNQNFDQHKKPETTIKQHESATSSELNCKNQSSNSDFNPHLQFNRILKISNSEHLNHINNIDKYGI
jgi:hypothetical protein